MSLELLLELKLLNNIMNAKKILFNYTNLIKQNEEVFFSDECINHLENSEIIIKYIGDNNVSNLIKFYKERLDIKLMTGSMSVLGYEDLICKLSRLKNENSAIYIVHVYAQNVGYILFHLKENNKLFYILKNYNMSIEKEEKRNEIYSELGYQISFYIKQKAGKIIASFE